MAKRRDPETATIDAVTHDGRGIAAVPGKKVFVAGALPGETVRFRRRKRRRNFDEAELLELIEPSPDRVEPRCAVYGVCGGCSLQHVAPDAQRELKTGALRDSLLRTGRVEPARWLPPIGADDATWNYRRRARLAVKDVAAKGRVLVGFRERHAPYVTDMHRCEVLAQPADALIDALSEMIGRLSVARRLPQIEVAVSEAQTALVMRVLDPPDDDDRRILREFAAAHDLHLSLQTGGPGSIQALYPETPSLQAYTLPDFDLEILFEATDFVQVNGAVNRLMVSAAVDLLEVSPGERALDLFCGIGNFSLPLARRSGYVLGLEGAAPQVERARANAAHNGIGNCEFRVADLDSIDGSESWVRERWDKLLLDPARSGAAAVAEHIEAIGPRRIVYVSCHPGTLARDADVLVNHRGYRLDAAGIIDMFPHTGHVESIALFEKN